MTQDPINLSYEVFPPRSEDIERQLGETLNRLAVHNPSFVSVTYGAGGSTRERTLATLDRIRRTQRAPLAGHLTCRGQSSDEVDAVIEEYRRKNVRHIVALRGDASVGEGTGQGDSYRNAAELTAAIRRKDRPAERFTISVAAYPDLHPDSASASADFDNLLAKFDAGADQAISQFFFMNAPFLRLRDKLAKRGIENALVAGILPVRDFAQVRRFARRCRTRIPRYISRGFGHVSHDHELSRLFAISLAADQVNNLIAEGVRDFHFYTLNHHDMTGAVCSLINAPGAGSQSAPVESLKRVNT